MKTAIAAAAALSLLSSGCSKDGSPAERSMTEEEFAAYLNTAIRPSGKVTVVVAPEAPLKEAGPMSFLVEWAAPGFPDGNVSAHVSRSAQGGDTVTVTFRGHSPTRAQPLTFAEVAFVNGGLAREKVLLADDRQWEWLKPRADMLRDVVYPARR